MIQSFEDARFTLIQRIETLIGEELNNINVLFDMATECFCTMTNRTEEQIYKPMFNVIVDLTIFYYQCSKANKTNQQGIKSISEGGVSITYQTISETSLPPVLSKRINKYKLNKCVNRKSKAEMFPEDNYDYYDGDEN